MVNALRKIHQSNVIMENINQTDKSMQLEYIHHEQDSKQLYIEMKDGLDKLKEKNFKIESECKDTLELNKKLLDINRSVEKEYEDRIKVLEYEDSTLVSCKSFIEDELLTKEMK